MEREKQLAVKSGDISVSQVDESRKEAVKGEESKEHVGGRDAVTEE